MEQPLTVLESRRFLGLTDCYQIIIDGLSRVIDSEGDIIEMECKKSETSFEELNNRLTTVQSLPYLMDVRTCDFSYTSKERFGVVFLCRMEKEYPILRGSEH